MNWFYARYVALDVKRFWLEILFVAKGGILPIIPFIFCYDYFLRCSVLMYFVGIVLFYILYVVCMLFGGVRKNERQEILEFIMNKFNRFRK